MEFTLHYRGPLKAATGRNKRKDHKHALASLCAWTKEALSASRQEGVLPMSSGPYIAPNQAAAHTPAGRRSAPARPALQGTLQVVATLRVQVRVHIEGDLCDRGVLSDEKLTTAQMPLANPEGPVADPHPRPRHRVDP
jgi:hypothetical protein